ncbi:histidine kinase [Mucilaginibacter daejeonensis]|uniref:sensor histidine kinase n=1 Tax=Mucilaginibacter daejeonensis TaxID=398049 RepID=UPI001D178C41|nr:histidine kinase [Mucilaginibacter daejeonensis]UEG52529.1 histidine kinase [Mucilaginibacter daejeonensis]
MRQQQPFSIEATIIAITIVFLILGVFVVIILLAFRKKRNTHIITYRQEMLKTRLEVQEQTLNNVSQEIHDNIGQVLSFVKLNLGLTNVPSDQLQHKMAESRELVAQAINDLRDLSKSLSAERIAQLGLVNAIEASADRVNRSELINVQVKVTGSPYSLGEQNELVLFRIFQETLNNAMKHARAHHFKVGLLYKDDRLDMTLTDDGQGFSVDEKLASGGGSGLKNIESRAALIGAHTSIKSTLGAGSVISIRFQPTSLSPNAN